jgi:spore coat protein H
VKNFIVLGISALLFFTACESTNSVTHTPSVVGDIVDSQTWYADVNNEVLAMSVEIPDPNSALCAPFDDMSAPPRPCTLADIDGDVNAYDTYEPFLNVKMFTADFPLPNELTNASFEQKGKSTRDAPQKSYRIKLDSKTNLYKKQRTFQLNKHSYDRSRIRNKMAFDFFTDIPNFTSLKTEFVHLNINNEDYGLFTHVEKVGTEFLVNRGWNPDDNIYKAQDFSFTVTPELSLNASGTPIDAAAFDASIEVVRGKKQTKLLEMLNAINNEEMTDVEFDAVFNRYFNRQNYLTWMALNIITANRDTMTQNFFLFNPLYSDTFYFMPWDYDDAGNPVLSSPKWQRSFSLWWDTPLHKRFLMIKKNRDDLLLMVDNLRVNYMSDAILKERLDAYKPVVKTYVSSLPDSNDLSVTEWEQEYNSLYLRFGESIAGYKEEFGSPMPFWQTAAYQNGILNLSWGRSVDLESDKIVYTLQIANDADMNNLIIEELTVLDIPTIDDTNIYYTQDINLTNGTYYMKVVAREENNASSYQIGFDSATNSLNETVYGVLQFEIIN